MKKLFSREIKIGLAFVVACVLLVYGVNFLSGINLFTSTNSYFATFESLDGLVVSNDVMVRGYKVGQVRTVTYDFTKEKPFFIEISVNEDISLPRGTVMSMENDGLLGGKFINLKLGNSSVFCNKGDTLPSEIAAGLMDELATIVPQISGIASKLDSTLASVNTLITSPEVKNSLVSIEGSAANLRATTATLNVMMNKDVPLILADINTITNDLKHVSEDLKQTDFQELFAQINATIANINRASAKFNSTDNAIGLLINDRQLYDQLNTTVQSANTLLLDLQQYPKRYVHFSLFGGKKEKEK
ncbi:MAG: MlaD family protein [Prevotellaceae bacterium]|jgi:phospholipid/cholesterol/gamma-HCH transport system substrate-binding protein|nr:MlaD family protein [Prevotellaceae bacterium]